MGKWQTKQSSTHTHTTWTFTHTQLAVIKTSRTAAFNALPYLLTPLEVFLCGSVCLCVCVRDNIVLLQTAPTTPPDPPGMSVSVHDMLSVSVFLSLYNTGREMETWEIQTSHWAKIKKLMGLIRKDSGTVCVCTGIPFLLSRSWRRRREVRRWRRCRWLWTPSSNRSNSEMSSRSCKM